MCAPCARFFIILLYTYPLALAEHVLLRAGCCCCGCCGSAGLRGAWPAPPHCSTVPAADQLGACCWRVRIVHAGGCCMTVGVQEECIHVWKVCSKRIPSHATPSPSIKGTSSSSKHSSSTGAAQAPPASATRLQPQPQPQHRRQEQHRPSVGGSHGSCPGKGGASGQDQGLPVGWVWVVWRCGGVCVGAPCLRAICGSAMPQCAQQCCIGVLCPRLCTAQTLRIHTNAAHTCTQNARTQECSSRIASRCPCTG